MRRLALLHHGLYGIRHPFVHLGVIVIAVLVIAAVVALVVMAVRRHGGPPALTSSPRDDSSERFLRDRLARGEITEDEYRTTVATLRETS